MWLLVGEERVRARARARVKKRKGKGGFSYRRDLIFSPSQPERHFIANKKAVVEEPSHVREVVVLELPSTMP